MRVVRWTEDMYLIVHIAEEARPNVEYSFSLAAKFCEGDIKIMIHEKGIIPDMDLDLFYNKSGSYWIPIICNGRLL